MGWKGGGWAELCGVLWSSWAHWYKWKGIATRYDMVFIPIVQMRNMMFAGAYRIILSTSDHRVMKRHSWPIKRLEYTCIWNYWKKCRIQPQICVGVWGGVSIHPWMFDVAEWMKKFTETWWKNCYSHCWINESMNFQIYEMNDPWLYGWLWNKWIALLELLGVIKSCLAPK